MNDSKPKTPFTYEPKVAADDRGVFVACIQNAHQLEFDPTLGVKRVYYVYNHGIHVVRGFHFHEKEWKLFTIARGAAKFVAINPKNPEEKFTFVSSSRKPNVIVIPPGFANGWISLEPETLLICGSTATFEESVGDDQRMDPYKFGDVWTIKGR
jgi:dTDP-4-dehydrorhamnose 3,5-epimerase-like enzyme